MKHARNREKNDLELKIRRMALDLIELADAIKGASDYIDAKELVNNHLCDCMDVEFAALYQRHDIFIGDCISLNA